MTFFSKTTSVPWRMIQKISDYKQLMKLNLSMLVVVSSVVGYIIVPDIKPEFSKLLWLFLGGLLVTAAANAANELFEISTDKIMKRTSTRPLPTNRMSRIEAFFFIAVTLFFGLLILYTQFNTLSTLLSFISFLLYVFLYTPLKKVTPISVIIGAVPGAMPCLIGWAAATGHIGSLAAWTLFSLQFFWQFPHFWSIAWVAHEDYHKAGLKMLPQNNKAGNFTAMQCVLYSAVLIPMSVLPVISLGGSWISVTGLLIAAIWMLYHSILFYKKNTDIAARKVMFASFVYLPLVLLTLVIDRFF